MTDDSFDYVVVGAGSAGCVVAGRLSADPRVRVLLLEAGPSDRSYRIQMPAAFTHAISSARFDWRYLSEPEPHLKGRRMPYPRGRVLGGSSSINAMSFTRGHPRDFEGWAAGGLADWSYAHCLPYFRKMETWSRGADPYRGGDGPLHVTAPRFTNVLSEVFLEACDEAGYPRSQDTNGRQHEGFGVVDQSIHQGRRMSTARAYLHPHAGRPNLVVRTGCLATRLIFEGRRTVGVQYRENARAHEARADREIIVSAGAINSPHLLMLSGIGDADELRRLGIAVLADLPAVGANLQDHLDLQIQQVCTEPVTTTPALRLHRKAWIGLRWVLFNDGLGATNHFEAGGNIKTDRSLAQPDNAVWFIPLLVNYDGSPVAHAHGYQVTVMQLQPRCRGKIRLRSTDPEDPPLITTRFLEDPRDLAELREGARCVREILRQPAFDRYRGPELLPGDSVRSDADLEDYIRRTVKSTRHPSCTCRMGVDEKTSVVDGAGRVHGIEGLRMVDASVMPSIPSAAINAATIMVAEKLVHVIAGETPLAPLTAEAAAALAA